MSSLEWFQFILSFGLQASLVTYIACAVERRCQNAIVKTRVWTVYYSSMLCVLAFGLLFPRVRWANPWQHLPARHLLAVINIEQAIGLALLSVWLIGSCFMLARWVRNFLRLQRFLRNCRPVDSVGHAYLQLVAPRTLLRPQGRAVEFRICPEELGPFCYQLHSPVVFLPPSLLYGDSSELQYVLQHELAHLRTQHPLQLFAQRIVQTALWYVPLVWRAGRQASLAREFVCDDAATDQGASTANYLRTLLRLAQQRPTCSSGQLGIARSTSELKVRAQRLASPRPSRGGRIASLAPAIVVIAALFTSQIWLPTNPLASPKSYFSPWPVWSAAALHTFDVSVRDFDQFDARLQVYDMMADRQESSPTDP